MADIFCSEVTENFSALLLRPDFSPRFFPALLLRPDFVAPSRFFRGRQNILCRTYGVYRSGVDPERSTGAVYEMRKLQQGCTELGLGLRQWPSWGVLLGDAALNLALGCGAGRGVLEQLASQLELSRVRIGACTLEMAKVVHEAHQSLGSCRRKNRHLETYALIDTADLGLSDRIALAANQHAVEHELQLKLRVIKTRFLEFKVGLSNLNAHLLRLFGVAEQLRVELRHPGDLTFRVLETVVALLDQGWRWVTELSEILVCTGGWVMQRELLQESYENPYPA